MPDQMLNWSDELSLTALLVNLGVGVVLAIVLRWHYCRFGATLSNREEFAQVFPFILLTTTLIITIVKSSLALSLGLVGALSIVRFRTPIKEPEELAYLFLCIAVGLGLGANQTLVTVVAALLILAAMSMLSLTSRGQDTSNLYVFLSRTRDAADDTEVTLGQLNEAISAHTLAAELRRFDSQETGLEATYIVDVESHEMLDALILKLREQFPGMGVTFLDQNDLPSV